MNGYRQAVEATENQGELAMNRLLKPLVIAALSIATLMPMGASAAKIEALPCTDAAKEEGCFALIVGGKIEPKDDEKFAQEIQKKQIKKALVVLNSPGGNLLASLQIGREIKKRGYSTVVPNDMLCTSSCGMIWLAGYNRYYRDRSHIGFHAAYTPTKRGGQVTGAGNALVGAYYADLGLSDKAILYLTSAPPNQMFWLSIKAATELGLNPVNFNVVKKAEAEPQPASVGIPSGTIALWNVLGCGNSASLPAPVSNLICGWPSYGNLEV
jgi:hypothetical protein